MMELTRCAWAGETHELRQELMNPSRDKKKDAMKKVIANMTVGKDVSMLFTDVVNCIQTGTGYWDNPGIYDL
jgi:vesicle coat complex subunit